jgi:signal transduction histidine kinase
VPEEIRPRHRTLRVVAALCPNTPHTYLVVRSAALDYVFDEIDAMFVHSCAALIANVQQADMLRRAASASARLLRGVSHELRTPLHALLSACELLSEESRARSRMLSPEAAAQSGTGGTGDSAALLAGALVSGRGLLGTVENLLMFDRMERGALAAAAHFGPLAALEQAVVDEAAAALVERGAPVTVLCESLLPHGTHLLWTDHDLLRKCLGALMNNAATFTHEGSISLCTWLEFDDTGNRGVLVFDVHDTGQGVPYEDTARVFEPFEKASTESTGLGLGLTVASAIARSLGGNVSLVQSSSSGSHFRLYLADPVLASQPGHVSTRVTRATLPKTFCILSPQPHTVGLDNAARALRHSGFKEMTDEPAIAALVLVEALASSDSSSTLESALKRIKANQLVVCLCQANAQAESCARAVAQRVSADLPSRLLTINGPLHQDRLWRTLSAAADVFDRLRISMDAMLSVSGSVALSRSALRILVVDDNVRMSLVSRRSQKLTSEVEDEP